MMGPFNSIICTTIIIVFGCKHLYAYRFLGVFPLYSRTHNDVMEDVMLNLAVRQHSIDVISHYRTENPPESYKIVVNLAGATKNFLYNMSADRIARLENDPLHVYATTLGNDLCELMGIPKMQEFIKNLTSVPKPYDAVLTEAFAANCFMGIGHLLNVPVIGIVADLDEYPWVNDFMGNPVDLTIAPSTNTKSIGKMNFWDRLMNLITYHYSVHRFYSLTEEAQTAAMRKYLRPDMPNIREIEKSTTLIMVNTHSSVHGRVPLYPSIVHIGGMHADVYSEEYTAKLRNRLENCTDGFVYVNLGTSILIEMLPKETIQAIYASFSKLSPVQIIMKVLRPKMLPPGLPENVLTLRYIEQIHVLRHAYAMAFVTNGGHTAILDAHYVGIPIIGIPFFEDEIRNIKNLVADNKGVMIDHRKITEDTLDQAFKAILSDPTYSLRMHMKNASKKLRDQTLSPGDQTSIRVEYVVRHGPGCLKPPYAEMAWYQKALLDIYAFLLICILITIWVLFVILSKIYRFLFMRAKPQKPQTSEKQD